MGGVGQVGDHAVAGGEVQVGEVHQDQIRRVPLGDHAGLAAQGPAAVGGGHAQGVDGPQSQGVAAGPVVGDGGDFQVAE